jgi:hypothetical protein
MSRFLTDNDPCPSGMHKGKPMKDVPADYLAWCWVNKKVDFRLKGYIERNYDKYAPHINAEIKHRYKNQKQ